MSKQYVHIIRNAADRDALVGMLQKMDFDIPRRVLIDRLKSKRSLEQNALFHLWMQHISKETPKYGSGEYYAPAEWKEFFKELFLGHEEYDTPAGKRQRLKRTRDLDTMGMAQFMEDIQHYVYEKTDGNIQLTFLEEDHEN